MGIVDDEYERFKPPPFDPEKMAKRGLALPPPLTERERDIFRDLKTLKSIVYKLEAKINRLEKGTLSRIKRSVFGQKRSRKGSKRNRRK